MSDASTPAAHADSVRLALRGEAEALALIQRRVWPERLPGDVADRMLAEIDLQTMTDTWQQAIHAPPEARCRVLVAVTQDQRIAGFAVTTPAEDPDADPRADGAVEEFAIDPAARHLGHGSRLLNACADTLRADGFDRATWWIGVGEDDLRAFLAASGWATDGAHREIGTDDDSVRLKQLRLHTDLSVDGA